VSNLKVYKMVKYLQYRALEGLGTIISFINLVLTFPQYALFLIPGFALSLLIIFTSGSAAEEKLPVAGENTGSPCLLRLVGRIFLYGFLLVGGFTTIRYLYLTVTKDPNACPPEHTRPWTANYRFQVPNDSSYIQLKPLTSRGKIYDLWRCLDPSLSIDYSQPGEDGIYPVWLHFPTTVGFLDAGHDPENRILEPNSSFAASAADRSFILMKDHTYFVDYGETYIRLHVYSLPRYIFQFYGKFGMYISYLSRSATTNRFDGLTAPWKCRVLYTLCE
jgi:hypothetical protein